MQHTSRSYSSGTYDVKLPKRFGERYRRPKQSAGDADMHSILINLSLQLLALILYIVILLCVKPLMDKYMEREFHSFRGQNFTKFLDYSIFIVLLNYPIFGLVYFVLYAGLFCLAVTVKHVVLVD